MRIRHLTVSLLVLLISFFSSCLKDKGNYDYNEINEITISGIDTANRYEVFSLVDTLRISTIIKGSKKEEPELFSYQWKIMPRLGDDTQDSIDHTVSNKKDLELPVTLEEGVYQGYFIVTDKEEGTVWGKSFTVNVRTLTSEGFMVLSEENGQGRLDMISNLSEDEFVVAYDVWQEEDYNLGKPYGLFFNYNTGLPSSTIYTAEGGSYFLNKSLLLSEASNVRWAFGSMPDQVNISGTSSTTFSFDAPREFIVTTSGDLYVRNTYTSGAVFDFPLNKINGRDEFTPSPIIGMPIPNNQGDYWPYGHSILLYDNTNKQFLEFKDVNEFPTLLHFKNTNLFPVKTGRDILFAASTLNKQTFAVLQDPVDSKVYIYGMVLGEYGENSQTYYLEAIGPDIENAENFAFHPILPYLFYSKDNRVYQFDYSQPLLPAKEALNYPNGQVVTLNFFPIVGWNPYLDWERNKALLLVVGVNRTDMNENPGVVEFYTAPSLSRPLQQKVRLENFGKIIDIQLREKDGN